MAKRCPTCKGRGRWQERIESLTMGTVELIWHFCEACHGTGISQDSEDGDDFDIGGSSYEAVD